MKLVKFRTHADPNVRIGIYTESGIRPLDESVTRLDQVLHAEDPSAFAESRRATGGPIAPEQAVLLAPIDDQEVWGAGVTYERSKVARQEESEQGASFYDLVYRAARPELFFKANPRRVVGPGGAIRVRRDTRWCVPEPELALVLSPALEVVGYTVGNDVSARDIEGENPLYLPQAKVYDECCGLGPVITLAPAMPPASEIGIGLEIERNGATVVRETTSVAKMARSFRELVEWLGRDSTFPEGAILLTGTGVVPPDDFSLRPGDVVRITIDGIGTLENGVVQGV